MLIKEVSVRWTTKADQRPEVTPHQLLWIEIVSLA